MAHRVSWFGDPTKREFEGGEFWSHVPDIRHNGCVRGTAHPLFQYLTEEALIPHKPKGKSRNAL